MQEFMMLFRTNEHAIDPRTAEEQQANMKHWQDWIGGIAAQGKFVNTGRLAFEGKTLQANGVVTDGPYAETKEILGGYLTVKADTLEEAIALADGCPALLNGGKVEVRAMVALPSMSGTMQPA
ncbi:MAG: transcription initiation protein [Sphingobacteriales bacterium]|nr:MAG: transcription initiation protein [Sphingobacteriales bacterium]